MKRLLVTQETINQFFMEFDLHKEWREFSTSSFNVCFSTLKLILQRISPIKYISLSPGNFFNLRSMRELSSSDLEDC